MIYDYCTPGFFRALEIFAYFAIFRQIAKISSRKNLSPRIFIYAKNIDDQGNFKKKKKDKIFVWLCFINMVGLRVTPRKADF